MRIIPSLFPINPPLNPVAVAQKAFSRLTLPLVALSSVGAEGYTSKHAAATVSILAVGSAVTYLARQVYRKSAGNAVNLCDSILKKDEGAFDGLLESAKTYVRAAEKIRHLATIAQEESKQYIREYFTVSRIDQIIELLESGTIGFLTTVQFSIEETLNTLIQSDDEELSLRVVKQMLQRPKTTRSRQIFYTNRSTIDKRVSKIKEQLRIEISNTIEGELGMESFIQMRDVVSMGKKFGVGISGKTAIKLYKKRNPTASAEEIAEKVSKRGLYNSTQYNTAYLVLYANYDPENANSRSLLVGIAEIGGIWGTAANAVLQDSALEGNSYRAIVPDKIDCFDGVPCTRLSQITEYERKYVLVQDQEGQLKFKIGSSHHEFMHKSGEKMIGAGYVFISDTSGHIVIDGGSVDYPTNLDNLEKVKEYIKQKFLDGMTGIKVDVG
ncbi:hypothetical protein BVY03_04005 [bacterium K02(2017)]|nr:hypothetical protein BVY03_04005 [bacterium K02(2017)]